VVAQHSVGQIERAAFSLLAIDQCLSTDLRRKHGRQAEGATEDDRSTDFSSRCH
jgi:hypothetical protein